MTIKKIVLIALMVILAISTVFANTLPYDDSAPPGYLVTQLDNYAGTFQSIQSTPVSNTSAPPGSYATHFELNYVSITTTPPVSASNQPVYNYNLTTNQSLRQSSAKPTSVVSYNYTTDLDNFMITRSNNQITTESNADIYNCGVASYITDRLKTTISKN